MCPFMKKLYARIETGRVGFDMEAQRVLVLSPHADDGELGCGGTISRMIEDGCDVYWLAMSFAEKSTPSSFPPDAMDAEMDTVLPLLGVDLSNVTKWNFEVRTFPQYRQEILDALISVRDKVKPDVVFCHTRDDCHQDHQTVTTEAIRAFKNTTILGYELPWNTFRFPTDYFVELSEAHVDKKVKALGSYASRAHKNYLSERSVRGHAIMRGGQINVQYAECFEVIRMIKRIPS